MRRHGRARVSRNFPQALAICDRCGFQYNHADLHWSFDWQGPRLANQRILVCNTCDDVYFEHNRTILIPADPVPIANPRPEFFVPDDNPISPLSYDPLAQLLAALGTPIRPSPLPPPVPVVLTPPIISSAGVYDTNGNLVRTIWSAQSDDPRASTVHTRAPLAVWDGRLDDGSVAPTGNYTIQLLENNVSYAWEGAVGNSSPDHSNVSTTIGGIDSQIFHYYHSYGGNIWDMTITDAGEIYFTTGYDERLHTYHVTTEANPQYANTVLPQSGRDGMVANHYCCTDGVNTYFNWHQSGDSSQWAVNCSTKIPTVFSTSTGTYSPANGYTIYLFGRQQDSGDGSSFVSGLAVQKSGNSLFVARVGLNAIDTFNKTTGALLHTFTGLTSPTRLATNPVTGDLWAINITSAAGAPAWDPFSATGGIVLSNSNLTATALSSTDYAYSSGTTATKAYFEAIVNADGGLHYTVPIGIAGSVSGRPGTGFLGFDAQSFGYYGDFGECLVNSVQVGTAATYLPGDNIGVAVDIANHLIWLRVNGGNWNASPTANPATGTGGIPTSTVTGPVYAAIGFNNVANNQATAKFASGSWSYAAPAGFSQLPGIVRSTAVSKMTVDSGGLITATAVQITGLQNAVAVAVSPDGSTVLVADGGSSQQVKAFNSADGSIKTAWGVSGTLGLAGGYDNGPAVTYNKFMFETFLGASGAGRQTFIAYSSNGSFWLGDPGNCRYLHFSAGNAPTYIEQISFLPIFYSCWVCYNDPTRVFGSYLEFKIDYSKPLAPNNGSWTLVNNWFKGTGVFDNYGAMRYTIAASNGRTYVPRNGIIYEMTATGYRNTGVHVSYDYIDRNFNLWGLASTDPGAAAIFKVNRFAGFDGSNNPTWTTNPANPPTTINLTTQAFPALFPTLNGAVADNNTSNCVEPLANGIIPVFDVHASTGGAPSPQFHFGGIDAATGNCKFAAHPPIPLNNGGENSFLMFPPAPAFGVATNSIGNSGVTDAGGGFQAYLPGATDVFNLYRGESWGSNQVSVWSHWHQSGLLINRTGVAAPYFGLYSSTVTPPALNLGTIDAIDASARGMDSVLPRDRYGFMGAAGLAGNAAWGGIALQNGNYYLYHGDEWYHGGVHRWKISNLDKIRLTSVSVSWNAASYVPAVTPYNFLSGLPFNTVNLPNNTGGWTRNPTADIGSGDYDVPLFRVYTNAINCDLHGAPDLAFEAAILNSTATATYSWTRIGSGNWTLTGTIFQKFVGIESSGVQSINIFIDVLDNMGKKLLRMYNCYKQEVGGGTSFWINSDAGDVTHYIRPPLTQFDVWGAWIEQPQPLAIHADVDAGTMTVNYAGYTMTGVTPYEVGADISHPAQFMLTYSTSLGNNAYRGLDIMALQFADVM